MFWGLVVQPNKKYSKTVSTPFHVSQAVLDFANTPGDSDVQLILKSDKVDYILCNLNKTGRVQVPLDLIFSEGDEISFRSVGGTVHLTGYLVDEQNFPEFNEGESSEDDDEEVPQLVDASKPKGKRQAAPESSGSENEEEEDDGESDDEVGSDDEEEGDDYEVVEESDDEIEQPPPKVAKTNGTANGVSKKADKIKDGKHKKQQGQQKSEEEEEGKPAARELTGGVIIEDIRKGQGAPAKSGRKVQVYYEGRFKTNNKIFDKVNSGKGFDFVLGRGSVIKGWDVGVVGMKVGGKRRITCPPGMAYGAKGSPPGIPPNSTIVFDVQLKNVL